MSYKLSKRSLDKLETCEKDLQVLMIEAIKESPFDFGISWGHRSPVKQKELFDQGRTTPGKIVTYVDGYDKKSKHNYLPALAVDIMCYVDGKITWNESIYLEVAEHIIDVAEDLFEKGIMKNRITYGGYWKRFRDYPHFQI
jgi:peptidoglycan L-alanyl-D-glutamate endopeptidase CwlK